MLLENTGLVLEGGGMRGSYTSGVLDALMDEGIEFPYVIGVSAGANNGANFVARQRERNKRVFVDFVGDKRYSGWGNLFKKGMYFGMDFLFDDLPNRLAPFDYQTFYETPTIFYACATDCVTGRATYFRQKDYDPRFFMEKILRASSSVPIICKPVEIDGRMYLDGGVSDSIPLEKSMADGNAFNVVVLTRNKGYVKKPTRSIPLATMVLARYPKFVQAMKNRHIMYNRCLNKILELEAEGRVFVFRPQAKIEVSMTDRNVDKIEKLYRQGYSEAMERMKDLKEWIKRTSGARRAEKA
ncbi:MAG TPA: patatin family protein [Clostridiales bacterium]|nr:patatin family protein [Clostridiales bacterium]